MSRTSAIFLPLKRTSRVSRCISLAFADIAGDIDIRQEMHLDPVDAIAAAGLAASAPHIEAEPALLVAMGTGIRVLENKSRIKSNIPV
jgi:hypothetical protein